MPRIADALSPRQYQGTPVSEMATAVPPTYAQQAAKIPGRILDALRALGAGQTYGTAEPTNSISDLARARLGRGSVFGVPEDVQQRNIARATEIATMAAPTVWHGSPHRFAPTAKNPLGEFDPTKIGSGEGAQVYGHGHYLAEAPETAQNYRIRLSNRRPKLTQELEDVLPRTIKGKAPDWSDAIQTGKTFDDLVNTLKYPWEKSLLQSQRPKLEKFINEAQAGGSLYKVDLPDEVVPRMVEWELPLSEMDEKLAAAINPLQQKLMASPNPDLFKNARSVGDIIQYSNAIGLKPHEALHQAGYPGIKYLDQFSRDKGTGTRNFVVFPGNEGLLNILGRE